jgi:ABC-type multidrug transport system permease subunit
VGYNQKSIANRTGLLFVIAINQAFNGVIGVLNTFPKEKVIVNRERSARAYDTLSYFAAKYLVEMPLNMTPCVWFGCIVYWIVGLNPNTFGYFLLILMLEALTATSLGLAVSALMPNVEAATAAGPPAIIIALLFGGFFININTLPIVANWLPYVSFLKWTFEALCINEFKGATFDCSNGPPLACEKTGEVVLARLSFGDDSVEYAVFGLGMVLLGFTFSAYMILVKSKISYMPLGHIGSKLKTLD